MDGLRRYRLAPSDKTNIDLRLLLLAVPLSHGPPINAGIQDRNHRRQALLGNGKFLSLIYAPLPRLTILQVLVTD
jgi:hypothetical protein